MAFSTAAKQALERLLQGPVQLMLDPGGGSELEVFVQEGLELNIIRGMEPVETDLVGVYDIYTTGDSVEFTTNLDEVSLDCVDVLFPEGGDGTDYRGIGAAAGHSMRGDALAARIRPWQGRDVATTQIELNLVIPFGDAGLAMQKADPWRWTQTWKALPDLDQEDGNLLGKFTFPVRS